ncbi:MAG: hypothetical protein AAGF20_00675 [Pseudomonadota bacterium]
MIKALNRSSLLAIVMVAGSFPLAAQTSEVAPETGALLYWVGHDGSSSYRFQEAVLYRDDDLTLYQSLPDESEAGREPVVDDFYILLSGVQYLPCDGELPTAEYRDALKAFVRNGAPDDEFEIVAEDAATLKIGDEEAFFLMGKTYQGTWVHSDANEESYLIDRTTGLNLKLRWDDGMSDTLVLQTKQKEIDFSALSVHLGACATLVSD